MTAVDGCSWSCRTEAAEWSRGSPPGCLVAGPEDGSAYGSNSSGSRGEALEISAVRQTQGVGPPQTGRGGSAPQVDQWTCTHFKVPKVPSVERDGSSERGGVTALDNSVSVWVCMTDERDLITEGIFLRVMSRVTCKVPSDDALKLSGTSACVFESVSDWHAVPKGGSLQSLSGDHLSA